MRRRESKKSRQTPNNAGFVVPGKAQEQKRLTEMIAEASKKGKEKLAELRQALEGLRESKDVEKASCFFGKLPDKEIAQVLGVGPTAIWIKRTAMGIKAYEVGDEMDEFVVEEKETPNVGATDDCP